MAKSKKVEHSGPMNEINVTPLVDVLLVLLIIFMITAPIPALKIKVDLPQPNPNPPTTKPLDPIHLRIDRAGSFYWNDVPVDDQGLQAQLAVIAQQKEQPEIQIGPDDAAAYKYVAHVLAAAKTYDLVKIGFAGG